MTHGAWKKYKAVERTNLKDGDELAEEKKYTQKERHKKFAVDCFNLVWTLMEKKDRTKEEEVKMIHAAHASRFHWGEIGAPANLERGEW